MRDGSWVVLEISFSGANTKIRLAEIIMDCIASQLEEGEWML
jgi:hypothetical protein